MLIRVEVRGRHRERVPEVEVKVIAGMCEGRELYCFTYPPNGYVYITGDAHKVLEVTDFIEGTYTNLFPIGMGIASSPSYTFL